MKVPSREKSVWQIKVSFNRFRYHYLYAIQMMNRCALVYMYKVNPSFNCTYHLYQVVTELITELLSCAGRSCTTYDMVAVSSYSIYRTYSCLIASGIGFVWFEYLSRPIFEICIENISSFFATFPEPVCALDVPQ